MLPKLASTAKARVIAILDASAETPVIGAASDTDEAVRRAALEALGRIGSGASVPALLAAAAAEAKPGKSTAATALARIKGDGAAAAIRQAAGTGDAKLRAAAITALAARSDSAALPAILRYSGDPDATVKNAAFAALGKMGTQSELAPLARLAISGKSQDASAALEAIASRATDKTTAAKQLLSAAGPDEQALASMLEALSTLGGDEALAAVTQLTASSNSQVRDDAIRALGNWSDFGAVKPLSAIAADKDAKLSQYVLAMQGIARLVKSSENEPAQARVDAATAALDTARRDDEKKLMLSALAAVPDARAAAAIKPLLSDANLKNEAGAAAMTLAESLRRTDRRTARDLAQAVKAANISNSLNERADRFLSR
jgi:HEAT repeat protein